MSNTRYKYQTVMIESKSLLMNWKEISEEMDRVLNNMADSGWELYQGLPVPPGYKIFFALVFRRPVVEE